MARYTSYVKVTEKRVFEVELPACKGDLMAMTLAICNEMDANASVAPHKDPPSHSDTAFEVTSDGEKLYFSYTKSEIERQP